MAPIRFKVENTRNVVRELNQKAPELLTAVGGVVGRAALRVSNRIVNLVQGGGRTGRQYKRRGGITHIASAPGEPPKSDTGFLASQVRPTAVKKEGAIVSSSVVISVAYSEWLEEGTSRMLPRPFVTPSFELEKPAIKRDLDRTIKQVIR